mgnify:CR=1 FL=1
MLKGWKTWLGIGLIGASGAANALGYGPLAEVLVYVGGIMGLYGIGHKVDRTLNK